MKKITIIALSLLVFGCSKDDTPGINPEPTPSMTEKPEAIADNFTVNEDEESVLTGILDNDNLANNARLYSIDTSSEQAGGIVDNRDGTFTYIPVDDFVGEDSFTYTICDSDSNCSTGTVKLVVEDAGDPVAEDDEAAAVNSMSLELDALIDNDNVEDEASIGSVGEVTSGTVILQNDNIVVYTPEEGFTGEVRFTYSLCDDDLPQATCSTATVTVTVYAPISFNIPPELQEYYGGIAFSEVPESNEQLLAELTLEKHTTILSYSDRHDYLYDADASLTNPENVVLMYSGEERYWREYTSGSNSYSPQTFNTEHVYPQSLLGADAAVTDLHHLRVADATVNSTRSNHPYTEGNGEYGLVTEGSFYPGDEWKGDVARMIMYLNVRYGEGFTSVGGLELFLKWNMEDPVSAFELQRQEVIFIAQGNRNPFIDNPYLATLIWGGTAAENRWN